MKFIIRDSYTAFPENEPAFSVSEFYESVTIENVVQ